MTGQSQMATTYQLMFSGNCNEFTEIKHTESYQQHSNSYFPTQHQMKLTITLWNIQ